MGQIKTVSGESIAKEDVYWISISVGVHNGSLVCLDGTEVRHVKPNEILSYLTPAPGKESQLFGKDGKLEFYKSLSPSAFIIKLLRVKGQPDEWVPFASTPAKSMVPKLTISQAAKKGETLFNPDEYKTGGHQR